MIIMSKAKSTVAVAASESSSAPTATSSASALYGWVWFGAAVYIFGVIAKNGYRIRMGAIDEFGPVIHEFDPYFNYRATEVSLDVSNLQMLYLQSIMSYMDYQIAHL